MEREAFIQEQSSLENQLTCLRAQINNLNVEMLEQVAKVFADFVLSCLTLWYKIHFLILWCRLMP